MCAHRYHSGTIRRLSTAIKAFGHSGESPLLNGFPEGLA